MTELERIERESLVMAFKRSACEHKERIQTSSPGKLAIGVLLCNTWHTLAEIRKQLDSAGGWFLKCEGEKPQEKVMVTVDCDALNADWQRFESDPYVQQVRCSIGTP